MRACSNIFAFAQVDRFLKSFCNALNSSTGLLFPSFTSEVQGLGNEIQACLVTTAARWFQKQLGAFLLVAGFTRRLLEVDHPLKQAPTLEMPVTTALRCFYRVWVLAWGVRR